MRAHIFSFLIIVLCWLSADAQLMAEKSSSNRADSLRGHLTEYRTCYDLNYYHLDVKINIEDRSISGSNEFRFTATKTFKVLQFDLFSNLKVEKVVYQGADVPFKREFNAVFLTFPNEIKIAEHKSFTVFYSGKPVVAKNPPWDGGFIFKRDKSDNPWISVACQGFGASSWWPTKDHQSDEVDSMLISISIPKGLDEISNGQLRSVIDQKDGYNQFNWFVSNPINNYNVTFYIGKYAHWKDSYAGEKGPLSIDYWSLDEDSTKARPHWDADVKRMLKSFEHWFGPYPFYEDGYKLVQAPHLGMEHQSAVAYGNGFKQGYLGRDYSKSAANWGLKFDYLTVHESGHEWFGNSITSKDIADMWIHEAFTSYSETIFLDSYYGDQAGSEYVISSRKIIRNDSPIIGTYGLNTEGSSDMYYKGANMIHTIRALINNDEKFRLMLRGMNKKFYHQTVTTAEIEQYIRRFTGLKLTGFFDQYLRKAAIPVLEFKIEASGKLAYRWKTDVAKFDMPVSVTLKPGSYQLIYPGNKWKTSAIDPAIKKETFSIDPNFYVNIKSN
ncbi:MAG: M1 family metallopeptidase [Pedobacter sp.]|nr:M1 family metallopeptidase [Pedobacter sp.]